MRLVMKNHTPMDRDVDRKENTKAEQSSELVDDDWPLLQPIWFRCGSIRVDSLNWGSMVRQFYYVLYGGSVLWACLLLSNQI